MRVSYNKCDHCHAELVNADDYIKYSLYLFDEYYEVDLCGDCANKLRNMVLDFLFPDSQELDE